MSEKLEEYISAVISLKSMKFYEDGGNLKDAELADSLWKFFLFPI